MIKCEIRKMEEVEKEDWKDLIKSFNFTIEERKKLLKELEEDLFDKEKLKEIAISLCERDMSSLGCYIRIAEKMISWRNRRN